MDLESRKLAAPAGQGEFGSVRFLPDSRTLIAADRGERRLSIYDVPSGGLITHLPLAVRPDNLYLTGGEGQGSNQLFITGEGMDAVVVVYPYHTPEVAETVLAGHAPGPMAASLAYLFVASPASGDLASATLNQLAQGGGGGVGGRGSGVHHGYAGRSICAGAEPQIRATFAVLRVGAITKNRERRASLLTVIPVGSRPVSAVVRAV